MLLQTPVADNQPSRRASIQDGEPIPMLDLVWTEHEIMPKLDQMVLH